MLKPLIRVIYRITLVLIYYVLVFPLGRWLRKNPSASSVNDEAGPEDKQSFWLERKTTDTRLSNARRQY